MAKEKVKEITKGAKAKVLVNGVKGRTEEEKVPAKESTANKAKANTTDTVVKEPNTHRTEDREATPRDPAKVLSS